MYNFLKYFFLFVDGFLWVRSHLDELKIGMLLAESVFSVILIHRRINLEQRKILL